MKARNPKSVFPPDAAQAARDIVSSLPSGGRSGCFERRVASVRQGLLAFTEAYKSTHDALCTTMAFITQKLQIAEEERDAALKELAGFKATTHSAATLNTLSGEGPNYVVPTEHDGDTKKEIEVTE